MNPGDLDTGQPILTAEQVAAAAGVTLRTFHNYHQTGRAPHPDGHVGRTPVWLQETVDAWLRQRTKGSA